MHSAFWRVRGVVRLSPPSNCRTFSLCFTLDPHFWHLVLCCPAFAALPPEGKRKRPWACLSSRLWVLELGRAQLSSLAPLPHSIWLCFWFYPVSFMGRASCLTVRPVCGLGVCVRAHLNPRGGCLLSSRLPGWDARNCTLTGTSDNPYVLKSWGYVY